jgi:WD40 repeat protein
MLWDLEISGSKALDVFNLDGNILATGSNDATTRIWDIRMNPPCIRIFEMNKYGVSSVKFMSDSANTITIGCDDSSIKLYGIRAIGKVGNYKEVSGFERV